MVICKHCGQENRIGELICHGCGKLLADLPDITDVGDETQPVDVIDILGLADDLRQITFEAQKGDVCRFPVSDDTTVILGRGNRTGTGTMIVNVGALGVKMDGVSRLHASLRIENNSVLLTDLGSTNGTYLNGRRLSPNTSYVLHSGDTILFGRLQTRVSFD